MLRIVLILLVFCPSVWAIDRVVYPKPVDEGDVRFAAYVKVLKAALDATQKDFGEYELLPASHAMSEARYMKELALDRSELSVAWSGPTYVDMASLHAVKEPIIKGLLSYRILLAHTDKLPAFSNIKNISELQKLRSAHAHGWGDSLVFDNAELPYLMSGYNSIFDLLQHQRVDYLSRGLTEVQDELASRVQSHPDVSAVPELMMFYPWPYYFYVNRSNHALEKRLLEGMRRIRESGEQDRIIMFCFADELKAFQAKGRRVIRLQNPWLEADWQGSCPDCWYQPEGFELK